MILRATVAATLLAVPSWTQAGRLPLLRALESTLAKHPRLRESEQAARAARGAERRELGRFDTVWSAGASNAVTPVPDTLAFARRPEISFANSQRFEGGLDKTLRSGARVTPSVEIERNDGGLIPNGLNSSRVAFQVNVPLLRGRGRTAVEADYRAAGIEANATLFDLNQTVADLLADTAAAYWRHSAALLRLAVFRQSEDRGKVYLDNVRVLVDADRIPPAEMFQVRANLSSRAAARIAAEQDVTEARQQLALAMGLAENELAAAGDPETPFPEPEPRAPETAESYVDQALTLRADLRASDDRQEAARARRDGARNATLPRLDLAFQGSYSTYRGGAGIGALAAAPFLGSRGPGAGASLRYEFPRANNAALGHLEETEAFLEATGRRRADLRRSAAAETMSATAAIHNASSRLEEARRAVKDFAQALEGEREKYRLGRGSLVDVLTLEDRLTFASANEADARLSYALAVVRLRLITGSIIDPSARSHSIAEAVFLTLPRKADRP